MRNKFKNLVRSLLLLGTSALAMWGLSITAPVYAQTKVLYLTFDDGPGAISTPRILNVLRLEHVHATFFVLGYRCRQLPRTVRRIHRDGHEIGSHGYDHKDLSHCSESVVTSEVRMTDEVILRAIGTKPLFYRPPYGALDRKEIRVINRMGHPVIFWTVDSLDWKEHSTLAIVKNVEGSARPGSVILFHDGISNSVLTAKALPTIIRYYRARGYVFRTL